MNNKPSIYCDVEKIPGEMIFTYWVEGDLLNPTRSIKNPSPEWLLDFKSPNKPYSIRNPVCEHNWMEAWHMAVATEAAPKIIDELKKNGSIDERRIREVVNDVAFKYMASEDLFYDILQNLDCYICYIQMPMGTKRAWIYSGEEVNHG